MKIAFLNKHQNKVNRGAETFVKEISDRLKKKHDVDVIADINYFDLFKNKYDLIIPTNGRFQVVIVRLITWLTGAKMIVSGQSGMGWDDRVNLYSFPDVFVPISSQALSWAKKVNPFVKSVYIPNGVDLNKFKPDIGLPKEDEERIVFFLKKPIVLCVAALTKSKRIDLVIKAVAQMKNASLLVVGSGPEKEKLKEMGERLLGKRFEINSFPHKDMPEVYRSADVFTIVSEPYYSFEIVLVEAMASGLGVVANNDPIRAEIVGEAGILVNPNNSKAYAMAIEKILSNAWKGKSRKQAQKFSWDLIVRKYEKIIKI